MGLTVKGVRALQPDPNKARRVYEGDGSNFGVRITPKGAKSYFQAYQSPVTGKRRFHNLGKVDDVALSDARERARNDRDLVQQGYDPQDVEAERIEAERHRQEQEAARGTVQNLVDAYVAHLEEQGKSSAREVRRVLERDAVPVLGAKTAAQDVTPRDVAKAVHGMIQRGVTTQSNRLRSYLYSAFRHGLHHDNNPMRLGSGVTFGLESNPADAVPRNPSFEGRGERELSWAELRRLWHEGPEVMYRREALYFRLVLTTGGQRVAEYIRATWDEVNLEAGLWTLPPGHTKNRRYHVVPLTATAREVLAELWELDGEEGGHLFPGRRRKGPVPEDWPGRAAKRLQTGDSPMAYWRASDLRRTWKTRAGEVGLSKEARDRVQNHALTDVSSEHYDRYDYLKEKREALEAWERTLDATFSGKNEGAEVVELGTAR